MPYATTASGLLVTYNINNGVQFVGRPTDNPPPYSEESTITIPPAEGPPPPYCSVENLAISSSNYSDGLPSYVPSGQQQTINPLPRSAPTAATTTRNNQDVDDAQVVLQPLLQATGGGPLSGD